MPHSFCCFRIEDSHSALDWSHCIQPFLSASQPGPLGGEGRARPAAIGAPCVEASPSAGRARPSYPERTRGAWLSSFLATLCGSGYGLVRTSASALRWTESSRFSAFMYAFADATMMSVSAPRPT